jgi:hypothetical protein
MHRCFVYGRHMLLPRLPPPVREWTSATLPRWIVRGTGAEEQPFDFCGHMQRLAVAVVAHSPQFAHVDVNRVLFATTLARTVRRHGLHARVTPLRFRGGGMIQRYGRQHYQVQRFVVDGREMLYIMAFCLPRFLNLSFDEKFVTLFHELYHIGPAFDGDLRRHHGRCHIHTHSKKGYDAHMGHFARAYLSNGAEEELHAFLRLNFGQLRQKHGAIVGVKVPRPRLIPVRPPTDY